MYWPLYTVHKPYFTNQNLFQNERMTVACKSLPSVDQVHQNIWTGSMDSLFLLPLKLVVIKDWVLRLWYNLNSCLLLKSLSLLTARNLQKVCTIVKSHHKWSPNWQWFSLLLILYNVLVLHQVLEAGSANISTHMPVYPWFIMNKHHVTDLNITTDE